MLLSRLAIKKIRLRRLVGELCLPLMTHRWVACLTLVVHLCGCNPTANQPPRIVVELTGETEIGRQTGELSIQFADSRIEPIKSRISWINHE